MKGILIDADTQTVSEVEHHGDYRDIYRLISAQPFDCRPLHGYQGEVAYFDDEFLLRDKARDFQWYADIDGLPDPIGGKILILGTDGEGNSVSTQLTVDDIKVSYRKMKLMGWTPMVTERTPVQTIIRGPRPIFDADPHPGIRRDAELIKSDEKAYRKAGYTEEQIVEFLKKGGLK